MRPRRALAALGLGAAAAGWLGLSSLAGGDDAAEPRASLTGPAATVARKTLVARELVDGTLGYADARTLVNRLAVSGGSLGGGDGDGGASSDAGAASPEAGGGSSGGGGGSSDGTRSESSRGGGGGHGGSEAGGGPSDQDDRPSDQDDRPSDQDDRPSDQDDRPSDQDDRPSDQDDRTSDQDDRPSDQDDRPSDQDDRPSDEDDGSRGGDDGSSGGGRRGSPGDSRGRSQRHGSSGGGSSSGAGGRSSRSGGDGGSSGGGAGGQSGGGGGSGGGGDSEGSATLTRTARPGSVVRRGGALYWVDAEPVLLMYGSTPAYRAFQEGVADGLDVEQLEANLVALGFDPGVVDEEFTSTTTAALEDWQRSEGLDQTGQVELGRVVFLPGARRIGARKTPVGQALADGTEVLETSSTRRLVKVELDVEKQTYARRGDAVRVTLPGGATVRGRITRVGQVAHAKSGSGGGGEGSQDQQLVVDVSIALRSARGTGRYDQAPVSVALASERHRNALVVPVEALLARRGGGYALELAGSGRLVAVRAGLFADGLVAVEGRGIREGTRVRVAE
jgi:Putative peptidoglycan binding domain